MEEASMMSVMKGWSSIRIPVDTQGQESTVGGSRVRKRCGEGG